MKPLRAVIAAYSAAYAGLPREIWLLAGALLVNRAGTMVLPFLSLYLTRDLELTAADAGLVIGCFGLGSMAGSFIGGWLSDRVDPVRVQQVSLIASGFGFLTFTQLESFAALAGGVLVLAAISDAFRPALMAAVAHRSSPEIRARAFALIRLAANLGMAIGPAAAGLLAVYGWVWIFVGDAVTCWAAAAMLLATIRSDAPVGAADRGQAKGRDGTPWQDLPFLGFMLLLVVLGMAFFQVWSTAPLYLRSFYGLTERSIGLLLALNALIIVLTEMLLIRAVENLDRMRIVGLGAFLVCGGLAILPFGPGWMTAVGFMVVLTVGEMLSMPITNAVVAERAGAGSVGRYMGVYTLAFSTAFVLGPIVGTAIYQAFGPQTLWYGTGAVGVVLAIAFAALSGPLRTRPLR
ncbi:MAG: MFS transporter [Acidobacteria bacterium]|uniref:MFS transporter n=1 Tax=Candidatus Sulfomarinibacter kjeldsenii TaxID=2885994 RepID=A0A8J6XXN2_9BACT|nr:MFS transporter [Candidatus Sulfomarinibacter kjeldsenii]